MRLIIGILALLMAACAPTRSAEQHEADCEDMCANRCLERPESCEDTCLLRFERLRQGGLGCNELLAAEEALITCQIADGLCREEDCVPERAEATNAFLNAPCTCTQTEEFCAGLQPE